MFSLDFKNLIKTKNLNLRPSQPSSQERPLFRITKPVLLSTSKTPVVTKKKPEEKTTEKNSILLEYKQYIESLEKMGNCNFRNDMPELISTVSKNNFTFHYVIGKGGFGKVWRVETKKNKTYFAMKEMSKSRIITKRSVNSVMNERHLLSTLKHSFLVNMIYAFQDRENLYLVMDIMQGGDLRFHISRQRRFSEEQTRFFVACILVGLEYCHMNGILHRDIKPENLVLDTKGYVRITDLGIARVWRPDNANDTSGTPGYMAPEVMCRQNHGVAVDYFALGVIAYEFMMGRRPYQGKSRKEIRDQILAKQVQIKKHEIPEGWSLEAADFVNRLIQRKPINRLGLNGPAEVKAHPWLKNYPWQKLLNKEIEPAFLPSQKDDNFDYKNNQISNEWKDTNSDIVKQNAILLRRNSVQNLFNGYNFDATIPNSSNSNASAMLSNNNQSMNTTGTYSLKSAVL
jgi:serine/threonine protein kinase